jgi:hypothetical protein
MGAGFATAAGAQAATVPTAPASAVPLGACGGDPGPFVDVTTDYGNVFHDGSPEYTDYNGTGSTVTDSFTNQWAGTIGSTISGQLTISESLLIEDASAQLGLSLTASVTATTGHTVTMTIPSHKYGHGEYGSWQRHIEVETYNQNSVCAQTNQAYTNDYLDNGVGWNLWTASS